MPHLCSRVYATPHIYDLKIIMKTPIWESIEVSRRGKIYTDQYMLANRMITVAADGGNKSTQIGGSKPEVLARKLLNELIDENKA